MIAKHVRWHLRIAGSVPNGDEGRWAEIANQIVERNAHGTAQQAIQEARCDLRVLGKMKAHEKKENDAALLKFSERRRDHVAHHLFSGVDAMAAHLPHLGVIPCSVRWLHWLRPQSLTPMKVVCTAALVTVSRCHDGHSVLPALSAS